MANNYTQQAVFDNSVKPNGNLASPAAFPSMIPILPTSYYEMATENFLNHTKRQISMINGADLVNNGEIQIKMNNVGFTDRIYLNFEGKIALTGALTSTDHLCFPEFFPFNLINNLRTDFNGTAVLHNVDGVGVFLENLRRYPWIARDRNPYVQIAGRTLKGVDLTADQVRVWIEDTGGNIIAATSNFNLRDTSKYTDNRNGTPASFRGELMEFISCGALNSRSNKLCFSFSLLIDFTMSDANYLGGLVLQNQNNWVTLYVRSNSWLKNNGVWDTNNDSIASMDGYFLGTNSGVSVDMQNSFIKCNVAQEFYGLPDAWLDGQGNAHSGMDLWLPLTTHSITHLQTPVQIHSSGQEALQFQFPNDGWLISTHGIIRNNFGEGVSGDDDLVDVNKYTAHLKMVYNNTGNMYDITPEVKRYKDLIENRQIVTLPKGVFGYDFTAGVNDKKNTNTHADWVNMYNVNNPQMKMDILGNSGANSACNVQIYQRKLVPNKVEYR